MHAHGDQHHGLGHGPPRAGSATRAFAVVTLINLVYTALEAAVGFATGSLALLSDALHNLGDVLGLAMAWAAAAIAERPPRGRHTYGWGRATLLSPLANALLLVGLSGALAWEALRRLSAPPEVPGMVVITVASIGIAVNLGAAWFLRGDGDLNRRGAYLHLLADAAISLAAVVAGAGMLLFGWRWLDPATALLVGIVVAVGGWRLLRDSLDAVMDAVPPGIDVDAVRAFLASRDDVSTVHHLHVWSLGAGRTALTAHLVRAASDDGDAFLSATAQALAEEFGIDHATLQVEGGDGCSQPCTGTAAPHAH